MTESESNGRIFISYRREDSAYATGWLYDRLHKTFGGGQIFKDVDSLEPGDDFVDKITTAVSSCAVLLAVIGREWLSITDEHGRPRLHDPDDFVRLELEVALARHVRVIPLLVEGATMPRAAELPEHLVPLLRRHALELTPGHFARDADELIDVLRRAVSAPERAPVPAPPLRTPAPAYGEAPEVMPVAASPARGAAAATMVWDDPLPGPPAEAPTEAPVPLLARLLGSRRRRLGLLALLVAVLAGLSAGTVFLTWPVPRSIAGLDDAMLLWPRMSEGGRHVTAVDVRRPQDERQLSTGDDSGIVLSGDRRSVLYLKKLKDGQSELHAMTAEGRRDTTLFTDRTDSCPGLHRPAWHGRTLAVVCDDARESRTGTLRLLDLDGEVQGEPLDRGVLGDPTFCADGATVIYWRNESTRAKPPDGGALYEVPVDRSRLPQRLTDGRAGQDADPACSPVDDQVVFRHTVGKVPGIYRIHAGRGPQEPEPVMTITRLPAQDPAWSPDATEIAFRQGPANDSDLWVMKADGTSPRPLVTYPEHDGAAAWTAR